MGYKSSIEWTDTTWNPVRGCTKISPGCKHCYASTFAERFRGTPGHPFEQGFDLRLAPHKMEEPLHWSQHRRIFVNSMSDLFHEGIPDDYIHQVVTIMQRADWHTYQVLTKRPVRMKFLLDTSLFYLPARAKYIWWGTSVEDRKHGLPRVKILQESAARNKFLSIEPLLEDLGQFDLTGISWVIVGAESGHGAREMKDGWVRSIRDQCLAAKIPFFFKQRAVGGLKIALPELDGKHWAQMPAA
jgi:protein gp37